MNPQTANGLAAAVLFARGRPEGLSLLPADNATALYSFRAALICLPIFLVLRLLTWGMRGTPEAGMALALSAELVGYVCSWAGFALVSRLLAQQMQRDAEWPQFLAAWNWTNIVQYLLLLAVLLPALAGLPGWLTGLLGLAALGYAVWLEWFVARTALNLPGPNAAMFVLADLVLGLVIGGMTGRISAS